MDQFTMITLRLIHIFSGVFWVGATFFMIGFVTPSVQATGAEGQKFMQHLGFQTKFSPAMMVTATLTMLSGIIMYEQIFGFSGAAASAGRGLVLGLGSAAGIAAWLTGFFLVGRVSGQMKALAGEMRAAGGPPKPEQISQMQALAARSALGSRITALLMTLSLIGMSAAQYAG